MLTEAFGSVCSGGSGGADNDALVFINMKLEQYTEIWLRNDGA